MRLACVILSFLLLSILLVRLTQASSVPWLSKLYDKLVAKPLAAVANIPKFLEGSKDFLCENEEFLKNELPDTTPEDNSEYDFIIVGAGAAGCVITRRLSEIQSAKILLIEAGGQENLFYGIPYLMIPALLDPEVNWQFKTEPSDKYCLGNIGRKCYWPVGKAMGGSTVINGMIASRGQPRGFDEWAEMGNVGWSYKDVLPYFKKLETMGIEEYQDDRKYHGTSGPLYISRPAYRSELADSFIEAARELGYPIPEDVNAQSMMGFAYVQTTIKNGTRFSGNQAYLHPIRGRRNVHVTHRSLASKVLFDRAKKRAIGVEFIKHGKVIKVYARKEVIVSAGTVGSPHLLLLSGIGPTDELERHDIDVVKDLPVGENLIDHVGHTLVFTIDKPVTLKSSIVLNPSNPYITDFLNERKGPLTVPTSFEVDGFIDVDDKDNISGIPNIEFVIFTNNVCGPFLPCVETLNKNIWSILPYMTRPKSRGFIRLKSKDVFVKPAIVPNYLDDPEDLRILIKGLRIAVNMSETHAMQKYGSRLFRPKLPRCDRLEYQSDSYWECVIRVMTFVGSHYAGTCKMGPLNDSTAVVDPTLKVIGIKGLRVADGSIMPVAPAAHTSLACYMVGEKAADMIKKDWLHQMN